jgi:type II secretion system protein N
MIPFRAGVRWIGLALCLPLLFLLAVYFFFPVQKLEQWVMMVLESQSLTISPGLKKQFIPGLSWVKPVLSSDQGALVRCDRLGFQPQLWPLLSGRAVVRASAVLGNGRITADYGLTGKQALVLDVNGVGLADIPFFKTALGASAAGSLWSEGRFSRSAKGLNGELKVDIKQMELAGIKLGGFPLPDVANLHAQGMVRILDSQARLESFTLQGEGIFMRLSGAVPTGASAMNTPLDLVLEIMPKPEFMEKQKLVFLLLIKFMTSPGVYKVPIRGTVLKPVIV